MAIKLPSQVYHDVVKLFPPPALLPKSVHGLNDEPNSGGNCRFLRLTKFRGQDVKSKFRLEAAKVEQI